MSLKSHGLSTCVPVLVFINVRPEPRPLYFTSTTLLNVTRGQHLNKWLLWQWLVIPIKCEESHKYISNLSAARESRGSFLVNISK